MSAQARAERAVLGRFPELSRLIDLREQGTWQFFPGYRSGRLTAVRGLRLWEQGFADVIHLHSPTDVTAVRSSADRGVSWRRTGGLPQVLDQLIALPPPVASALWTP